MPIISRELRAAARQPFTYYVRVLGVAALLLACLFFGLEKGFEPNQGGELFVALHVTLFAAIWILVPPLTADCISRERREGTLGLLFLTGLSSSDIVVAKGLAYGLRSLTLWLAVLPVVTIPFLLGGLNWTETALSVMVNFSSICWALAAALLASAWSKRWLRALLNAVTLAIVFLIILGDVAGWLLVPAFRRGGWGPGSFSFFQGLDALTFALGFVGPGGWLIGARSAGQLLWAVGQVAILSVLVLLLAILVAGNKTRRVWQEEPPSPLQLWWQRVFCTPIILQDFFQRWLRRKLARNPIGWLEQRTWTGRLVTWGWFAVVVSLYSAIFTDRGFFRGYSGLQVFMGWLLAGSMAMTAVGSFRRERETGVMELLLVSPLGEKDIIWGRLRGLWGQFLPATGLLLGVWLYFSSFVPDTSASNMVWFFGFTFVTLPIIGLYFSLRCRNFLTAFLATLALGLLVPLALPALVGWLWWLYGNADSYAPGEGWSAAPAALWQLVLAAWLASRLYQRLRYRAFPLGREERQ